MKSNEKNTPWWLSVVVGVLIIAVGIFLLVSPKDGNDVLTFIVGLGVFIFCIINIVKAIQSKNDNRLFIPYLAQALLDIVLLLLIISIPNTPELLGIIIACWLFIFGFFEIIQKRQDGEDRGRLIRNGSFLMLAGIGVLIIPFLIGLDQIIFIGIVALIIGVVKTVQGFIYKVRSDERTSGGRSNLY